MRMLGPDGPVEVAIPGGARLQGAKALVTPDGEFDVEMAFDRHAVWVWHGGHSARFAFPDAGEGALGKEARAPMTGKVAALPAATGDRVKKGDTLAILEAMKMEYRLAAEADGEVAEVSVEIGELVDLGQVLVRLK